MRLSFAVVTALFVVTGCANGGSDVCGDAAEALAACGFDVPADFDTQCAADPEMFAAVNDASCPSATGKEDVSDWIPLYNGDGDTCAFDGACQSGLTCVPSKSRVQSLGIIIKAEVVERQCAEPRGVDEACDDADDCQQGLTCLCVPTLHGCGGYGHCKRK